MAGSIYRDGVNYSNAGPGCPATSITFLPETSGLKSKNVNDAIIELANILNTAVAQFVSHTYEYPTGSSQAKIDFVKETLKEASRAVGGFHLFSMKTGVNEYIGMTHTVDNKCSFTLHSVDDPKLFYYGYFDDMDTASDKFYMYQATGTETNIFEESVFPLSL